MPGSGGEEDEINIGMEVVVDPDDPNQKPMTTYVEAQVNISEHLKACLGPALVTVLARGGPPRHSVSNGFGSGMAPLPLR